MKSFTGPGSTPSRRRFWDQVTAAVNASRKIAGRHVTVSEHEGKGTLVNVDDTSLRRPPPSGVCIESITLEIVDVTMDCGCLAAGSQSFIATGSVNTTLIIPLTTDLGFACRYDSTINAAVAAVDYFTAPDCTGSHIDTIQDVQVTVFFIKSSSEWQVTLHSQTSFFGIDIFLGSSTDPLGIPNTAICDCSFLPCGAGHEGIVNITF